MNITGYHAHVYYDTHTREAAARVRSGLETGFAVRLGRWHDIPVGPHPQAMYQVAFMLDIFDRVVPWLMLNHEGLSVLIHPETGGDLRDHTDHALWLGEKLALDVGYFSVARPSKV